MPKDWVGDDVENDWLAKELKEEDYHGCMAHSGTHPLNRAPEKQHGQGFLGKAMHQEDYRACREHGGTHEKASRPDREIQNMKRKAGEGSRRAVQKANEAQNGEPERQKHKSLAMQIILVIILLNVFGSIMSAIFER